MPTIGMHGDVDDRASLLATMLFPSDDEQRFLAFARYKTEQAISDAPDESTFTVDAKTLRTLLSSPSSREFAKEKANATRAGYMAGFILATVYLMEEVLKHPMPSVNKAIHAYLTWGKTGALWGDGKPLPASDSTVREAWSTHKTVSHLWAAQILNSDYPFAQQGELFRGGLLTFLEVAAGLLEFGFAYKPAQQKTPMPVLDRGTAWKLPASIQPRRLVTDRIPDGLRELLTGYKAPQSLY